MTYDIDILLDFVSSLALVAILALAYGTLRRRFSGPTMAPVLLGFLFGTVTIIQMHTPLTPMEGLIIDMRNVPIALAGAFLGLRGLAVCLIMAMATRYGIGGVGWISGVAGMIVAGGAGLAWDRLTRHRSVRGARPLMALGVVMCSHLVAAVLLPVDIAIWFLTVAAPPIVALNLVSIPLVGALLERERQLMAGETRLKASASTDPDTGLLTQAAFAREVSLASSAGRTSPVAGILIVGIGNRKDLAQLHGSEGLAQVSGALRHRLKSMITHCELLGQSDNGDILVPLLADEMTDRAEIETALRRGLTNCAIALPGGESARPTASVQLHTLSEGYGSRDIRKQLEKLPRPRPASARAQAPARPNRGASGIHHALFAKSERLARAIHG